MEQETNGTPAPVPDSRQAGEVTVERYKKSRFWAVYEGEGLLVVAVYRKGAQRVADRLQMPILSESGDSLCQS